jgi:predicted dehydrogenase
MGKPISAKASMDTRRLKGVIEVEDIAEALIKFENGANLLLYATNCHLGNPPPFVEIVCEKGTARIEDKAVVAYNDGRRETATLDELSEGDKHYWGSSHGLLIRDFYDKIVSGEQFALSGEEGLKALEIVDGIYESAKTGREVFFM